MATDLITKLEEAGEGSRSLDLDLLQALGMKVWGRRHPSANTHQWMTEIDGKAVPVPRWTTSLDAALALAERLGLDVPQLLNDALEGPGGLWARGWRSDRPLIPQIATALCAAILRASEEKQS